MGFTYKKATDSDETLKAREREAQLMAQKPAAFQFNKYQEGQDGVLAKGYLDQYLNREPFKYDLNGDALFRQYQDNAKRQGKMAMMDTAGQAAAMTGGYGNSYAQTVGQQVYNNSLAEVNNVIPELWQMAYDRYNAEGDALMQKYGLLSDRENQAYGRHMDEENQRYQLWGDQQNNWLTQMGWARDDLNTSIDRDRADASEENEYAYRQERDAVSDEQWQKSFDLSKASTGSSGGSSGKNLSISDLNTMYDKCESLAKVGKTQLSTYLNELVDKGYINADTAADLYNEYFPVYENVHYGNVSPGQKEVSLW